MLAKLRLDIFMHDTVSFKVVGFSQFLTTSDVVARADAAARPAHLCHPCHADEGGGGHSLLGRTANDDASVQLVRVR